MEMNRMGNYSNHLPEAVSDHAAEIRSACSRHSVSSLSIVGSAARADFDPARSDIDVLVDFMDADINYFRAFMGLRNELTSILGRKVDVITRRGIRNPLLLRSLEQDAIQLFPAHAA
jgi:predicted nucleotidyltransferase